MSQLQGAFLGCIGIGIVLCALVYVFESRAFSKTGNSKYSLFRYFPFELNCFKRNSKVSYVFPVATFAGTILFALAFLFFALEVGQNGGALTSAYIMFSIYCLLTISFNLLRFIKLSNYHYILFLQLYLLV